MARLEIRLPWWLKRRALEEYPNLSKKIRELLEKDLGPKHIKKVTSVPKVGQKGGHLS
jgi:hypothetical protein